MSSIFSKTLIIFEMFITITAHLPLSSVSTVAEELQKVIWSFSSPEEFPTAEDTKDTNLSSNQ